MVPSGLWSQAWRITGTSFLLAYSKNKIKQNKNQTHPCPGFTRDCASERARVLLKFFSCHYLWRHVYVHITQNRQRQTDLVIYRIHMENGQNLWWTCGEINEKLGHHIHWKRHKVELSETERCRSDNTHNTNVPNRKQSPDLTSNTIT